MDRKAIALALLGSLLVTLVLARLHLLNLSTYVPTVLCMSLVLGAVALAIFHLVPQSQHLPIAIVGAIATCGIYLLTCNEWVSIIGDNVVYIRDGMRLLEGKRFIDAQYGIGVKAMLVPALAMFPDSVVALKAVIALSSLLYPLAVFFILREFTSSERALAIALISGTIWLVVGFSSQVTADLPYPTFSLLALAAILQYVKRPGISWTWLAASVCAVGWAYHVKAPAMFLVIASAIYLFLRGKIHKPLLLIGGAAIWIVPWIIYLMLNFPGDIGYFSSMDSQISMGINMPEHEIGGFWHNFFYYIFQKNLRGYLYNLEYLILPREIMQSLPIHSEYRPVGWCLLFLIAAGFIFGRNIGDKKPLSILRSLEIHDWYTMGYTATLFTLPFSQDRYLIPILPVLIYYIFQGFEFLIGRFRLPVLHRHGPTALAGLLLLPSLFVDIKIVRDRRMTPGYSSDWKSYYNAAVWMRQHTPAHSHVITRKPNLVWFWARREAKGYPRIRDAGQAWQELKKYDYILLDNIPLFPEKQKYIKPVFEAYPDSFIIEHVTDKPQTYVIKIKKQGSWEAYYRKGSQHRKLGNLKAAVEAYRKALKWNPGSDRIQNSLAVTLLEKGDLPEARRIFQELVDRLPDRIDYRMNLAVVLLNQNEYDAALIHCRQALKVNPNNAKTHALMGRIYQDLGNLRQAREAFAEALKHDPKNTAYQQVLKAVEAGAAR